MDWRVRLEEEEVNPEVFFTEILPEIYEERGADEFGEFSEVPLVVSFLLEGEGGGRWTVTFDEDALEVEEGEAWDDPLLTVAGQMIDWPLTRQRLVAWLAAFEEAVDDNSSRVFITEKALAPIKRMQGTIALRATGYSDDEGTRDLESLIYLNSYEKAGEDGFQVVISAEDYQKIVDKTLTPAKAFADGMLRLEGNVSLAMQMMTSAMRFKKR